MAVGVEDPGGLDLCQRSHQSLQPRMQHRFAGDQIGLGQVADDLGDLRQAAVDGLEYFQRMFIGDIERAFDLAVGGVADRDPGDGGGKYKQRQRQSERGRHHPLQQSQRITLRGLHARSGSAPSLTQDLPTNEVPSMEPRTACRCPAWRAPICLKLQMPGSPRSGHLSPGLEAAGSAFDHRNVGVGLQAIVRRAATRQPGGGTDQTKQIGGMHAVHSRLFR